MQTNGGSNNISKRLVSWHVCNYYLCSEVNKTCMLPIVCKSIIIILKYYFSFISHWFGIDVLVFLYFFFSQICYHLLMCVSVTELHTPVQLLLLPLPWKLLNDTFLLRLVINSDQ